MDDHTVDHATELRLLANDPSVTNITLGSRDSDRRPTRQCADEIQRVIAAVCQSTHVATLNLHLNWFYSIGHSLTVSDGNGGRIVIHGSGTVWEQLGNWIIESPSLDAVHLWSGGQWWDSMLMRSFASFIQQKSERGTTKLKSLSLTLVQLYVEVLAMLVQNPFLKDFSMHRCGLIFASFLTEELAGRHPSQSVAARHLAQSVAASSSLTTLSIGVDDDIYFNALVEALPNNNTIETLTLSHHSYVNRQPTAVKTKKLIKAFKRNRSVIESDITSDQLQPSDRSLLQAYHDRNRHLAAAIQAQAKARLKHKKSNGKGGDNDSSGGGGELLPSLLALVDASMAGNVSAALLLVEDKVGSEMASETKQCPTDTPDNYIGADRGGGCKRIIGGTNAGQQQQVGSESSSRSDEPHKKRAKHTK